MSDASDAAPVMRVIDCHVARHTAEGWRYLVLRRAPGRVDAGRWRVVTGKIEVGEAAWQAALRELREETGLEPEHFVAVPYVNHFYEWREDRINAVPVFLAVAGEHVEPVLDGEHVEHRWLALEEAVAALSWPGMRDGMRAADALLRDPAAPMHALEVPIAERD
jgi:dATP pyrophosphohydrolase